MKTRRARLCAGLLLALPVLPAYAHGPGGGPAHSHGYDNDVPVFQLLFSGSPSDAIDRSKVWGVEMQGNLELGSGFALGLHGMLQNQEYGTIDTDRWGVGASLNYYMNLDQLRPFVGVKRTYYGELGGHEDALDCLYCSDVDEDYEGGEDYLTAGLIFNKLVLQLDYRLSDRGSDWSESGYDPWGVGPTFYDSFDGVPDPEYILHIGFAF
ncbi:MAG: hypothetical protein R3228_14120 [Halioglobus sp.]|nr:hypothetical protein [Halioglobus sp.]